MRLTLRTLLAYLDDCLEPNETKEIGAKIAESGVASTLVERIRDVMRRRRLSAPDVAGPQSGLDVNTVAEYLDNTLPAEQVADVERVCLESDVHLAEVAAAHQILTLVLGEPLEIAPSSKERMYGLGPVSPDGGITPMADPPVDPRTAAAAKAAEARAAAAAESKTASSAASDGAAASAARPFADTIPDYLKPKPFWRRAVPYTIVLLVIGAWLGLIAVDPSFNFLPGVFSSKDGDGDSGVQVASNDGPAVANAGADRDAVVPAPAPQDPKSPSSKLPGGKPPLPADPPEPPDDPAAAKPAPLNKPPAAVAAPDNKPPGENPEDGGKPPVADPAAVAGPQIQYTSRDQILLHFDPDRRDWFIVPPRSVVNAGETIVVPEPFEAVLDVKGAGRAVLLGPTAFGVLPPVKTATLGFAIDRGRMIFEAASRPQEAPDGAGDGAANGAANGTEPRGAPVNILIHGRNWTVQPASGPARFGIEVVLLRPQGKPETLKLIPWRAAFFLQAGSVQIDDGTQPAAVIHSPAWVSLSPGEFRNQEGAALVHANAAGDIPRWLDPDASRLSSTDLRYAKLFGDEFIVDPADEQGLSLYMPPTVKNRNPRIASLAAKTLALTNQIDEMVKALANSDVAEEARLAVIDGLRAWLPQAAENDAKLKASLAKYFRPDDAEIVHRLLWGFDEDDARDESRSLELVDWLEHNHVAVRELALLNLRQWSNRRSDYHPLLPAVERAIAVENWREFIERNGALRP